METVDRPTPLPRPLPVVGGDLALDFANTVDDPLGPARHDHVATYPDLVRWSGRVGVLAPHEVDELLVAGGRDPRAARRVVASGRSLRDALNEVFGSLVDDPGRPVAGLGGWEVLRRAASRAMGAAVPAGPAAGELRWGWPDGSDLRRPLHPVALAATDLLVSPGLARLGRCARCPWLFLDTSRNGSRRWCAMDDCGRAQKIERYVARRAARRRAS